MSAAKQGASKNRRSVSNADEEEEQAKPLAQCPTCTRKTTDKILRLATRGERPFANLIHEQFTTQAQAQALSKAYPNGGRKVLLFSDGRQKAARLARDLPREVEFDTFRQALALAVHRLTQLGREPTLDERLYTAFVSICHDQHLHFFDSEDGSQAKLLQDALSYEKYSDGDLELALEDPFKDPPLRYHQALLDQLSNPFYAVYSLGAMVVHPSRVSLNKINRQLESLPQAVRDQMQTLVTLWVQVLLERGAFDKGINEIVRAKVLPYGKPVKTGHAFKSFEQALSAVGQLSSDQIKQLRAVFYEVLTDQDAQGDAYLRPSALALRLAFDDAWLQCDTCGNLQHQPLLGRCATCSSAKLVERQPADPYMSARYDYFRQPLRAALRGERPTHITAEEHTAQLSQRDRGRVYATTEEFELRFQDIALSDKKPPVDVLSCTTTMEVGIDIGSLVAIGMRNVPPQRENYQQRAGRSGRRGSAVSTVVTYADNGAHDHFYYHHPEGMISGAARRPQLKLDSKRIAQRHLGAYLIQTFFHSQLDRLAPHERSRIASERKHLATALGSLEEFYKGAGPLSFSGFRTWVRNNVGGEGEITHRAASWLPDELFSTPPNGEMLDQLKRVFIAETAAGLVVDLERIATVRPTSAPQEQAQDVDEVERSGEGGPASGLLLDTLFDEGLLPSYAFPTDLVSFYVFGTEGERVVIKERPQQSKMRALSEYAPGRLLVVNKETYRVGGIFVEGAGYRDPAARLFAQPLAAYVFCPCCTYVRLEPLRGQERCPVCANALEQRAMLDPPGFAPEGGRPLDDRDRDQDISYASGAQLPTPLSADEIEWRSVGNNNLQYAYAQNRQLVTVNKGPSEQGFGVCTSCGAAWPFADRPKSGEHKRPYLMPGSNRWAGGRCRGEIHASSIYLGSTFRTDVLVLRLTLRRPMGYDPRHQWLHDALQTTAEALTLAASRTLDVDPAELSAGYRLMPPVGDDPEALASVDFYLFDTASGGAGYAAEAGEELPAILAAALDLVEQCPEGCERSCTRCMRHYGNRFFHDRLDRRLASVMLRYAIDGEVQAPAPLATQRQQLVPLRRYLELEGWREADMRGEGRAEAPLLLVPPSRRAESRQLVAIGTYPALVDPDAAAASHPLQALAARDDVRVVLLSDFVVARDLPTAYQQLRRLARVL